MSEIIPKEKFIYGLVFNSALIALGILSSSSIFTSRTVLSTIVFTVTVAGIMLSLVGFLAAASVNAQDFLPLTQWGRYGTSNGSFNQPYGIAIIPQSANILVSDNENNRIQMFSGNGTFITDWGRYGTANGSFNQPHGIAADSQGNVYVADTGNNRIQMFSGNGTFITDWGRHGVEEGRFKSPTEIAISPTQSGNVYVADTGNQRIQIFTQNIGSSSTSNATSP